MEEPSNDFKVTQLDYSQCLISDDVGARLAKDAPSGKNLPPAAVVANLAKDAPPGKNPPPAPVVANLAKNAPPVKNPPPAPVVANLAKNAPPGKNPVVAKPPGKNPPPAPVLVWTLAACFRGAMAKIIKCFPIGNDGRANEDLRYRNVFGVIV